MTKKEARTLYKEKRLSLTVIQRDKFEDLLLIQFQKMDLVIPDMIFTYAANERLMEYDPGLVERFCKFRNPFAVFAYPKVQEESLNAILVDDQTTFAPNRFGIEEPEGGDSLEPSAIQMAFIPLLAFDKKGYRVGYGKGYYDRFLSNAGTDLIKIGFSFFDAEELIEDTNEFDIPLDICITPYKTYHFN